MLTVSCRHVGPLRTPAGKLSQGEEILIEAGDSSQASYSPTGDRLTFVSAGRPGHQTAQVYVKYPTNVEQRITYSNGAVQHPHFHPREPLIVYASSTDELKEYSPLLNVTVPGKRPPSLGAPMEIYVHDVITLVRDRLTTHAGFDGQPRFGGDGRSVTWTQSNGDQTRVQSINRFNRGVRTIAGLIGNPSDYVASADNQTAAWLEYDPSFTTARLMVRRQKKTSEIAGDRRNVKVDLSLSPDARWLFWAEQDPTTQAYAPISLELETGCVRPVGFTEPGSRRDPVLSPDLRWLMYTIVGADKSRVARSPFDPRPGPCAVRLGPSNI